MTFDCSWFFFWLLVYFVGFDVFLWFLVVLWCVFVVLGGSWWFLVFLVFLDGSWLLLVIIVESWCIGGFQWFLGVLGGS